MRISILIFAIVFSSSSGWAWEGIVCHVADGDTIVTRRTDTGEYYKIRLYGIDCPEGDQPYGAEAAGLVRNAVLGKRVGVIEFSPDRYERAVGAVVELESGMSLEEILLSQGLAWVYPRYCSGCGPWKRMQEEARSARLGLWADENPVAPWEWREKKR